MKRTHGITGHFSSKTYQEMREGKLSPVRFLADLLWHLVEVCPGCAAEGGRLVTGATEDELREALARGLEAAREAAPEPPPAPWETMVEAYLALPHASRLASLTADPWAGRVELALALVERAQRVVAESRGEARELVELAFAAAGRAANETNAFSAPQLAVVDALAGAWAVRAEADLLDERPQPAQEALLTAQLLLLAGSGDPNLLGAVAMAQALFEWKLDDTDASVLLLTEAAELFRSAGEPCREAMAWTRQAIVLDQAGRAAEADQALVRVEEISQREGWKDLDHVGDSLVRRLLARLEEEELGGEPS